MESPFILEETEDFAVVFKPPRMHTASASGGIATNGDSLFDWYAAVFPPVKNICGKKEGEGGLVHRLDFETQGLVLFAKNQKSLNHFLQQQAEGKFIKEYTASYQKSGGAVLPSFPPPPFEPEKNGFPQTPFFIESFFRPYGPGRKQVRPVIGTHCSADSKTRKIASDKGRPYQTEIVSVSADGCFTARLRRGFRHQIRCHLAWVGCPVLNDPLYGHQAGGILGLRATGLFFTEPGGGYKEFVLPKA